MGKWADSFTKGIDQLVKIKFPVKEHFKNVQAFVQTVDAAEAMHDDIFRLHKEIKAAQAELDKKTKAFAGFEAAVAKNIPAYDKAILSIEKANKLQGDKDLASALTGMKAGLNRIEGLVQLKNKKFG